MLSGKVKARPARINRPSGREILVAFAYIPKVGFLQEPRPRGEACGLRGPHRGGGAAPTKGTVYTKGGQATSNAISPVAVLEIGMW